MSEKLEQVKTAIAEKLAPAIDMRAPYAKIMVDAAARAAIEAMREPTEAMWRAPQPLWSLGRPMWDWWRYVIDEVLK